MICHSQLDHFVVFNSGHLAGYPGGSDSIQLDRTNTALPCSIRSAVQYCVLQLCRAELCDYGMWLNHIYRLMPDSRFPRVSIVLVRWGGYNGFVQYGTAGAGGV